MSIELLGFQQRAVESVLKNISAYNPAGFIFGESSDPELCGLAGEPKPYLGRLKAVTGAGKTAMLAAIANRLKDCIVLWTTQRGAIVDQTTEKLADEYHHLLPAGTEVIQIQADLFNTNDWHQLLDQNTGTTILTATIASFNQDQEAERLKIHKGPRSPWEQLMPVELGGARKRSLWVFYDEGHHATTAQFHRLFQLRPQGFLLASANEISEDLYPLIPGETATDKTELLKTRRTTEVDTSEVVGIGLLKSRMEIHDLDEPWKEVLKHAKEKRDYLETISPKAPVACYIVDSTANGLEVWEELVKLGVPNTDIAVHLAGAKLAAKEGKPHVGQIVATHDEGLTAKEIRDRGFKHLIWNLSLEEGWDEPWAYVAYFHSVQRNVDRIRQRVGRLIRNPHRDENGQPALAGIPEMNTAFFYMRAENEVLQRFIEEFKKELNTDRHEIVHYTSEKKDENVKCVPARENKKVPQLFLKADCKCIERLLGETFQIVRESERQGPGEEQKHVVEIATGASTKEVRKLDLSMPAKACEVIQDILRQMDWRLVSSRESTGGWIHPATWSSPDLQYEVCFNSCGYEIIKGWARDFVTKIPDYLNYATEAGEDYIIGDFRLINPNGGEDEKKQHYYRVHAFQNSVHKEYNGFNQLELAVANEIDRSGWKWARNPAKVGYRIPLKTPLTGSNFFPDFIVWRQNDVLLIDPKGSHLLQEALKNKLVPRLELPTGISIHLLADGAWRIKHGELLREGPDGYSWVTDFRAHPVARAFRTLKEAVAEMLSQHQ